MSSLSKVDRFLTPGKMRCEDLMLLNTCFARTETQWATQTARAVDDEFYMRRVGI
jgi:hypothetical protein